MNMSLQLYISQLNKHPHFCLHNISLRLLRSVNTLNPTLKFKTILMNKLQLLLKALYLEATLTFLRFAAKHCSISQLFGDSYQLYGANYVTYIHTYIHSLFGNAGYRIRKTEVLMWTCLSTC